MGHIRYSWFIVVAQPLFSVFIPTYNRATTLTRAISSVAQQRFTDFELIIVDDGSTDKTDQLVAHWAATYGERLRFIRQPNQGKHAAYNRAAQEATGELLVLLDSDDVMLPDALAILAKNWHAIPEAKRSHYAGIEGLCRESNGKLHGQPFPYDGMDSNYLEMTRYHGVSGEKRHAIRVDILRQFPYPIVEGEKHVRPSFVWKQIAHRYQFRYINEVLQIVDFRADGLTRNASRRRLRNPGGLYLFWRDDILHHTDYLDPKQLRYAMKQYIRYGLLSRHGLLTQWNEVSNRRLWASALIPGLGNFLTDYCKRALWSRG